MIKDTVYREVVEQGTLEEYLLKNDQLEVRFLNFGGAITKIALAKDNFDQNLVCNYDDYHAYFDNSCYLNALVGRTSNRITDGKFSIDGTEYEVDLNDGPNNLHGGAENLSHTMFDVVEIDNGFKLTAVLPEQPKGFPGNLEVTVTYTLEGDQFVIEYEGQTDKATLFNPTQHAYFNLSGNLERTIYDHVVQINASKVADVNEASSFTLELLDVEGTRFDFRNSRVMNPEGLPEMELFNKTSGYDHLFILDETNPAVVMTDPVSGRKLEVFTTERAVQCYAGNYMDETLIMEGNRPAVKNLGICFETHDIPFDYEAITLRPGQTYKQRTVWKFTKA